MRQFLIGRLPGFIFAALAGLLPPIGLTVAEAQSRVESESGGVIDIPGLGPIPIPLPPGSRVFGPGGTASPPARPLRPPETKKTQPPAPIGLDELLVKLAGAGDEDEAGALAKTIRRLWARSGSDTADLLLERARLAVDLGQSALAKDLLDYAVTLRPKWTEALVRRAKVKAALGDGDGALSDLGDAVRLEPKRFDAFAAIGAIEESKGRKKPALEAYRRSLQIDPWQDDISKSEERLRLEVDGRDI